MKNNITKNIVAGFGGQFLVLLLGIIVPRVFITSYGSDANGLLSTVSQIFTYMALLEAGIGQAARNALYKPLSNGDREQVCEVVSMAKKYFRKLTVLYALCVVLLTIFVPSIIKSSIQPLTVRLVVLFQGFAGVITFYYIQTQTIILGADGRGYVNNTINVINQIASYTARIILAVNSVNIALVQFVYLLITIGKVFVYEQYFKRNYSWLKHKAGKLLGKLPDRNAYILSELSWVIFSSTDMIVLSSFVGTAMSSVYSVYNMVFSSLNVLLNAVYSSVVYILGQSYHQNKEEYVKVHDAFTSIFVGMMTVLMCVSYQLILPFVSLYTKGVSDTNYIYPLLPLLFCLIQMLSWSRYVSGNLTAIAGYAKSTGRISLIEALINIFFSLMLVQKYGIFGVCLATVIALPIKVVYCTYLSDKIILKRSCKKSILILIANYALFFGSVIIGNRFKIYNISLFGLMLYGILFTTLFAIIGVVLNSLVNESFRVYVLRFLKSIKEKF